MSDQDTEPKNNTRPVKRVGRSLNLTVQVMLFIVVIVSANYLSCARHHRYDLTERKDFTLSDTTRQYLDSETIQDHGSPVKIIAIIRRKSPHFTRIFNLLEEYKRLSGEALELEFVDPIRQTDRTLEIENTYKQPYTEDMIIVDGRKTSPDTDTPETPTEGNPAPSPAQQMSAHVRFMRVIDLMLLDERGNIDAWQDEDIITSAIIGAIEGMPRRIYFAADKINLDTEQKNAAPPWQNLANLLLQQNILLTPLRLSETDKIPEDAEGFALIGPQYDLNPREIKVLSDYWDLPKSSLLLTLDPKAELPNLRVFLRSYGVTPRKDRIMTLKNDQPASNVHAVFSRGSEITVSLGGKSTIFEGYSSSLDVSEDDNTLINRRIRPISLAQAVKGWWGETRFDEETIEFNKEEDSAAPIHLAAAVLRGKATSDATENLVSRMVIVANTDFLATSKTRPEQADFIRSSVNWLVGRDELIGIGPQKLHRHKITILDAHDAFISKLVLLFIPLASLLTAMIVWNTRRA